MTIRPIWTSSFVTGGAVPVVVQKIDQRLRRLGFTFVFYAPLTKWIAMEGIDGDDERRGRRRRSVSVRLLQAPEGGGDIVVEVLRRYGDRAWFDEVLAALKGRPAALARRKGCTMSKL